MRMFFLLLMSMTLIFTKKIMTQNTGPRGAKIIKEWFQNNPQIPRMNWPVNSPDLNPIENCWKILKDRVNKWKAKRKENLFEIAENIWNDIPTEMLRNINDSMPKRVQAVIAAHGGTTKY